MCVWVGKWTRFLRRRTQLQDTRQKDRSKKRIHSVNPFCFVVFRPQSLLDFLESRVMKRKSINHCVYLDAYKSGDAPGCKGLLAVVRLFWEVDVSPVSPNSTTRIRAIAFRNGTLQNPSQCEGFGRGHCHLHSSIYNIRHCNIYSL